MRVALARTGWLALGAGLLLSACTPAERMIIRPFGADPSPTSTTEERSGFTLASFDLIDWPSGELIGSYRNLAGNAWVGPHPLTGNSVSWSGDPSNGFLVLYTNGPPVLAMTVRIGGNNAVTGIDSVPNHYRAVNEAFR